MGMTLLAHNCSDKGYKDICEVPSTVPDPLQMFDKSGESGTK